MRPARWRSLTVKVVHEDQRTRSRRNPQDETGLGDCRCRRDQVQRVRDELKADDRPDRAVDPAHAVLALVAGR